jgi:adenylate kinase family enzyme
MTIGPSAARVVVIGNSGGGKSTLARELSARRGLPHIEIDAILWQPGWTLTPREIYDAKHARAIAGERWMIDGLGRRESIAARLARATEIILVDMPLWSHFWLAAERQIAWAKGPIEHPPAGIANMPPTEALFRTIWEVDRDWMPEIRRLVEAEEAGGKRVSRITQLDELDGFAKRSWHSATPE